MNRRRFLVGAGALASAGTVGYLGGKDDVVGEFVSNTTDSVRLGTFDATAAELQLSANQFEDVGWEKLGGTDVDADREINEADVDERLSGGATDASVRYFYNHQDESLVVSTVAMFDTVGDAKTAYSDVYDDHRQTYSLQEFEFAPEAHGYITDAAIVVFRDANAVAVVGLEPGAGNADIEATRNLAELMHADWP